ncbi:RNA polymerase-associated protein LEO1-like [Saccoglossus kowalevskii]|uniref:RNA polymerase-associated protein LEO1-like n=1 Tax=Saccoglossus kowalevskii TaxID=10224 RepID=A0ABM0MUY2_SACKO|nr:PREDICTED: RNA polymerase-associated protein LEO1-like [Saccoglossus kowalevskii]
MAELQDLFGTDSEGEKNGKAMNGDENVMLVASINIGRIRPTRTAGATHEDLFGDAGDISSESDDEKSMATTEKTNDIQMEGDEQGDDEPEEVPLTKIEVEIPKITPNLGSEVHFAKLPNFLSVETRPFDAATYEDEIEEERF